jgi:hypothetical protein
MKNLLQEVGKYSSGVRRTLLHRQSWIEWRQMAVVAGSGLDFDMGERIPQLAIMVALTICKSFDNLLMRNGARE